MGEIDAEIDATKPSVARAYDYVLGGKDNFEVDREFVAFLTEVSPGLDATAKANKEFGRRAVTYMAEQGVGQFLDLGSGIPTSPPSVHDSARKVVPDAKVVYVDHDPVVVAHNRALRATGAGLTVIQESFLEPDAIFGHPDFLSTLDPDLPIGVLILSVFQNTHDDAYVREVLRGIRHHMAPGSFIAISHISQHTPEPVKQRFFAGADRYGYPSLVFREDSQLEAFFDGFDLLDPGLTDVRDWRPSASEADDPLEMLTRISGGVARLAP